MLVRSSYGCWIKHNVIRLLNNTTRFDCLFVTFTLSGDHDNTSGEPARTKKREERDALFDLFSFPKVTIRDVGVHSISS